jgi:hypothetical protein
MPAGEIGNAAVFDDGREIVVDESVAETPSHRERNGNREYGEDDAA